MRALKFVLAVIILAAGTAVGVRGHNTQLDMPKASSTMKRNTLDSDRKGAILSGYGQEIWTPGATGARSDYVYVPLGQEHLADCQRAGPQ